MPKRISSGNLIPSETLIILFSRSQWQLTFRHVIKRILDMKRAAREKDLT